MNIAEAQSLSVRYGELVAIADSDFEIKRGAITAIIGPNGSGKSTLLSTIAGLVTPATGHVTIADIGGHKARISYVLQSTKVNEALPISVREVVTMGRFGNRSLLSRLTAEDHKAVDDAMQRLDIAGLENRPLHELSGGQRQRVLVAQGLAQDHDLLLLDEPLTGIDLLTAQAIDTVIHDETARGCTVVMTTHDLSEAQAADFVILLAGRVIASGKPEGVVTAENLVAAYGPSLVHVDQSLGLFIDDPAHAHSPDHHKHQDRTIHTEANVTDHHRPG